MSVVIKGMKLPKNCLLCPCCVGEGIGAGRQHYCQAIDDEPFADGGKKDTMSLTLALIVLDRLNTTERIDVARDKLAEAVRVVSAAAKYRIPQKPEKPTRYWATLKTATCPRCKYVVLYGIPKFCPHCGQAIDWSD